MADAHDHLTITSSTEGAVARITLTGELDAHTAPALAAVLGDRLDGGADRLIVDATALRFCDSSGIQVLVQARERIIENGGTIVIEGAQRSVEKVFAVTGLLDLFTD
jgi:anti-sigma B factor antagonist